MHFYMAGVPWLTIQACHYILWSNTQGILSPQKKKKFNLALLSVQTWYLQMTRKEINVKGIPGNKSYLYDILTPFPTKFEGKEKT